MTDERSWLLTYSNLMTIFLVFFIILYVFARYTDAEQFEKAVVALQTEFGGEADMSRLESYALRAHEEEMARFLNTFIDERGIAQFADVKIERDNIVIMFAEPLVFESGRADLKSDVIPLLQQVADILRKVPNPVVIEGHTDDVPISPGSRFSSNWELSLERAFSVVHYFTTVERISGERFIPTGYGEYSPVAPNDTPENRAKNRRIEMRIRRAES